MSTQPDLTLTIDVADENARLDKVLATHFPELSRSRIKALMMDGAVTLNGTATDNPSQKVRAGMQVAIAVPPPEPAEPKPENIPLTVVYEDEAVIVIDKPAGLVVHPGAGHEAGTLVNALLHHCGASLSGINGVLRPGIVHRLDKDTSGLMVAAKSDAAHKALAAQFADHGRSGPLTRQYLALAWGVPQRPQGTIEGAIARSTINREKMAIVAEEKGRFAITHYAVEESFSGTDGKPLASLIACTLETGRTHQIRLHLAHIGHPLLNDETYGAGFRTKTNRLPVAAREALETLGRQALHAALLGFEHPLTGAFMEFESPLPDDFERLITTLRGSA